MTRRLRLALLGLYPACLLSGCAAVLPTDWRVPDSTSAPPLSRLDGQYAMVGEGLVETDPALFRRNKFNREAASFGSDIRAYLPAGKFLRGSSFKLRTVDRNSLEISTDAYQGLPGLRLRLRVSVKDSYWVIEGVTDYDFGIIAGDGGILPVFSASTPFLMLQRGRNGQLFTRTCKRGTGVILVIPLRGTECAWRRYAPSIPLPSQAFPTSREPVKRPTGARLAPDCPSGWPAGGSIGGLAGRYRNEGVRRGPEETLTASLLLGLLHTAARVQSQSNPYDLFFKPFGDSGYAQSVRFQEQPGRLCALAQGLAKDIYRQQCFTATPSSGWLRLQYAGSTQHIKGGKPFGRSTPKVFRLWLRPLANGDLLAYHEYDEHDDEFGSLFNRKRIPAQAAWHWFVREPEK